MTKKERNQQEIIYGSDLFRLVSKSVKDKGYNLSIEEVKRGIIKYLTLGMLILNLIKIWYGQKSIWKKLPIGEELLL